MRTFRNAVVLVLGLFVLAEARADDSITAEGIVDAPVAEVWAAWTTSAGLRAWLAPHADVELRVGALMRTNYSPNGSLGDASTIENRILSFEPERMLSIQVARAPADFPFKVEVANMWTVLYFEPMTEDKTRIRIVGLGFTPSEQSQKMKMFFERGNAYTLAQLQKRFRR
jgi:uncharacterized protein YndB with AHSA1/START domain